MEVRPGFTQTDIGAMPEGWEPVTTAEIVDPHAPICYGVVQVGQNTNGGVPIVAIKYVKEISSAPLHRAALAVEQPYARSRVRGGDVLISIKGTIGRVGVVPTGFEGNISRELARLRPRDEYAAEYILQQLESHATQARISRAVVGTTRLEFSIATLRKFEIPVPSSLTEQRAIAAALSDVDALLGGLDRLIAKKRDLKSGVAQQLLTGHTRLPGFVRKNVLSGTVLGTLPQDWNLVKTRELAFITTGARNTQDRVADGKFPFFVRSATVERINTYSYDGEAVLTAGDGVGTGKVFHYISGKFDLHQRAYRISNFSSRLDGYYFYLHFSSRFYDRIMSMTAKSSVDSVRMEMIADMLVPLPTVKEQRAIALVLREMDHEIAALEARRDKTRSLKQAMMQELLTGKSRLVPAEPAHD